MGKFNGNHKTDTTDIGDARISAKSGSMGTNRPFIHNFRGGNHGTHWKTVGNGFTNCHNIRYNVEVLACPHFAGTSVATLDFVENQDLIITLVDIAGGFQPVARPGFGMSKGGGEIPWYVHELPVIVIGCGQPFVLADIPQARTYINTYDSADQTFDALIEKLMSGSDAFIGEDPVDAYCGLWDTHRIGSLEKIIS